VPKVEPFDEAFASRFSVIPFPNLFTGEDADPNLADKITAPEELSGFFNKTNDATLADRIQEYKYHASPVERFIDEMCIFDDPDSYVMKDTLFRSYVRWSVENHVRSEKMKDLTVALQDRGCVIRQVTADEGDRKRVYIGVDFKHRVSDFA